MPGYAVYIAIKLASNRLLTLLNGERVLGCFRLKDIQSALMNRTGTCLSDLRTSLIPIL